MLQPRVTTKTLTQLALTVFLLCPTISNTSHAATVIAASVLPVSEYTRITIESDTAISYSTLMLKNPDRIVLDLKNTQDINKIKVLSNRPFPEDSTIKQIRVAKYKQNITRVVIDLRANAKPKMTQYAPASGYQYRLTLDVIPAITLEPGVLANDENSEMQAIEPNRNKPQVDDNGAKIILDREPVFEPDLEVEPNH